MCFTGSDSSIQLVPMHQLAEVKDYWEDDWTGLADARLRRKKQNRLSKRAQRKRKRANNPEEASILPPRQARSSSKSTSYCHDSGISLNASTSRSGSLRLFDAIVSNKVSPTRVRLCFPLPPDHLLTLIQYNAYHGLIANTKLLCPIYQLAAAQAHPEITPPHVPTATVSPFVGLFLPSTLALPPSLFPTSLQLRIPHPSWIDSVPLAPLRDNLIKEIGSLDEAALCLDTLGCLFHEHQENNYSDRRGLIVWAEPWSVSSWELSDGFVRRWAFLLKGCEDLVKATNHWRAIRGESPLSL